MIAPPTVFELPTATLSWNADFSASAMEMSLVKLLVKFPGELDFERRNEYVMFVTERANSITNRLIMDSVCSFILSDDLNYVAVVPCPEWRNAPDPKFGHRFIHRPGTRLTDEKAVHRKRLDTNVSDYLWKYGLTFKLRLVKDKKLAYVSTDQDGFPVPRIVEWYSHYPMGSGIQISRSVEQQVHEKEQAARGQQLSSEAKEVARLLSAATQNEGVFCDFVVWMHKVLPGGSQFLQWMNKGDN